MQIFQIAQNIGLLLFLLLIYGFLLNRLPKEIIYFKISVGILFGLAGIIGWRTPVEPLPGITFEGLPVVLSIAGLFGGPIVAFIAALISGLFHWLVRGDINAFDLFAIITSSGIGIAFYYLRRMGKIRVNYLSIIAFAFIVHFIILGVIFSFSQKFGIVGYEKFGLQLFLVYPIITIIIAHVLLETEIRIQEHKTSITTKNALINVQPATNMGTWSLDLLRNRLTLSEEACRILGIDQDAFESDLISRVARMVHPEDRELFLKARQHVRQKSTQFFPLETRIIWPDGSVHHLWVESGNINPTQKRNPNLVSGIIFDITTIRKAENELRESESRFKAVSEYSHNGICLVDDKGKILWGNEAFLKMGGYSLDQVLSAESFIQFLAPESVASAMENFIAFKNNEAYVHHDSFYFIRADGEKRLCEKHMTDYIDRRGSRVMAISMIDITEIHQSQSLIETLAERLNLAAKAGQYGIWDWDIINDRLMWDDRMYELYGYGNNKVFINAYQSWLDGVHPDDRAACDGAIQMALKGEKEYEKEFRVIWPDEGIHYLKAYGKIVKDDEGRPVRMTGINYDITDNKLAEIVLRESDEKRRKMIANISDVIGTTDKEGRATFLSPNIEKWFGWQPDDLLGTICWDLVHPEDLPAIRSALSGFSNLYEKRITIEFRFRCKNGNYKTIELTAANLISDPSINGNLINFHDISERKSAEEELLQSKERLKRAENIGRIGNWELNVETREHIWSDQMFDLFERDPNLGAPVEGESLGYLTNEVKTKMHEIFYPILETGEPIIDYEIPIRLPSGKNSIFSCSTFALKDENEKVIKLFGVFQDITDRKRIEEVVRTSHEMLLRLTDQVPGVVYQYRLNPDGSSCFPFSSAGMKEIYEYSPEEVQKDATPVFGRLHPEDYDYVASAIFESARTLNLFHVEYRVVLPKQGLRWRTSYAKPERTPDGGTLWYGIIMDITDRKIADEKIKNQMLELHRWQDITLGREDRILQLKKEVNHLLAAQGNPAKYQSVGEESQSRF
jgi:PAS domain S-box-containing protein